MRNGDKDEARVSMMEIWGRRTTSRIYLLNKGNYILDTQEVPADHNLWSPAYSI